MTTSNSQTTSSSTAEASGDLVPDGRLRLVSTDVPVLVGFTLLYGVQVTHAAVTRAFWLDELFTFYIVTMPDWAGMFDLIRRGPDQNPPLFYVVTRLLVGCFGESEWAFRLPAIGGYWLLCLSLYILGRRLGGGSASGLVAMATPLVTGVVFYASEARPYGLMLGCFGLGLVCYHLTGDASLPPDRRRSALLGLGGGLSLGMAFHYMMLLPLTCLWLVELYRTQRTRQHRWAVWAALLAPLGVLAYNWPLFIEQAQIPYWKTTLRWSELPDFYWWLINPPACLALLTLLAVIVLRNWQEPRTAARSVWFQKDLAPEWPAMGVVSIFVFPIGWMVLMQITGKTMFTQRYLLPAVVGLSIWLVYVTRRLTARNAQRLAVGVWVILATSTLWVSLQPWRLVPPSTEEVVNLPNPSQPVIVSVLEYLPLKHYFGSRLPQVVYVFGVLSYPQPQDPERGLRALLRNPRTPRFEDKSFLQRYNRLYVVCHKVYGADSLIPLFKRRNVPIVRETANYFVYDYAY
ncbi:MAG: glycosyltransferase family 39 protein [Chloracidobacterium sp.]|nr:glycosyltransferase family 39 protein [Chloracidobacterium sp.]MDW8218061.1 glycosyltransferase family 39 protein [Acidobacteriota bacterium]